MKIERKRDREIGLPSSLNKNHHTSIDKYPKIKETISSFGCMPLCNHLIQRHFRLHPIQYDKFRLMSKSFAFKSSSDARICV